MRLCRPPAGRSQGRWGARGPQGSRGLLWSTRNLCNEGAISKALSWGPCETSTELAEEPLPRAFLWRTGMFVGGLLGGGAETGIWTTPQVGVGSLGWQREGPRVGAS